MGYSGYDGYEGFPGFSGIRSNQVDFHQVSLELYWRLPILVTERIKQRCIEVGLNPWAVPLGAIHRYWNWVIEQNLHRESLIEKFVVYNEKSSDFDIDKDMLRSLLGLRLVESKCKGRGGDLMSENVWGEWYNKRTETILNHLPTALGANSRCISEGGYASRNDLVDIKAKPKPTIDDLDPKDDESIFAYAEMYVEKERNRVRRESEDLKYKLRHSEFYIVISVFIAIATFVVSPSIWFGIPASIASIYFITFDIRTRIKIKTLKEPTQVHRITNYD